MRALHWLGSTVLTLVFFVNVPAHAGLIGGGTNTVDAQFFLGAHILGDLEDEGTKTIANPSGAHYPDGAIDESRIDIGDIQITITNDSTFPYCSTSLPCSDSFTGFEFIFSSGVNISGVSVDAATNVTMDPVSLTLVTPREILIDMTGDAPALGDKLVIDLAFPGPRSVPEPTSLVILGTGLIGLLLIGRRRAIGINKTSSQSE